MQTDFDHAAESSKTDILMSHKPPFGSFAPGEGLKAFYAQIAAHQAKEGAVLLGGFVFGGAFADLHVGRTPKDYDIYIASPNMVRALKAFQSGDFADDDYMNEDEWAEAALGYDFPMRPHIGLSQAKHADVIGEYFEFNGSARIDGVWQKIDIKIGTKNPTMGEFLRHTSAPIMAAAMSLDSDDVYAYHRDFTDHAERGILCTEQINRAALIEKARRKDLELITPAALAARESAVRAPGTVSSLKAGELRPVI